VSSSPEDSARQNVLDAYRTHLRAMVAGDTDALSALLADGFTLTHMTGYVQPATEWLTQMDEGRCVGWRSEPGRGRGAGASRTALGR
jgi:hypothetical protein